MRMTALARHNAPGHHVPMSTGGWITMERLEEYMQYPPWFLVEIMRSNKKARFQLLSSCDADAGSPRCGHDVLRGVLPRDAGVLDPVAAAGADLYAARHDMCMGQCPFDGACYLLGGGGRDLEGGHGEGHRARRRPQCGDVCAHEPDRTPRPSRAWCMRDVDSITRSTVDVASMMRRG